YWVKSDLYVGLAAAFIQFGFNIWRLVFVCLSLPMYEFWHEGLGKHIFSGVATACAIVLVQTCLIRLDGRERNKGAPIVISSEPEGSVLETGWPNLSQRPASPICRLA